MSEMVERVAKVLREIDFEVGTPNYYQAAAAVIEAMREPTEAMVRAALDFPKLEHPFIDMKNAWAAATREALK